MWWTVIYPSMPVKASGDTTWAEFEVAFVPKSAADMAATMQEAAARRLTDEQLVLKVVEAWRGKLAEGSPPGSAPIPFTDLALRIACVLEPCFVAGVMEAFMAYAARLTPSRAKAASRFPVQVKQLEKQRAQSR